MRTQTAARREEESVGLPRHAGCFRPLRPLSPHVAAHILTNEDKCLRVLATFQGSFPQINHSQFYPCPLGRLAGAPGCGRNEGHIVTPPTHTLSFLITRRNLNGRAKPPLPRAVTFCRCTLAASRPPSSPLGPLETGSSSQLLTSGFH